MMKAELNLNMSNEQRVENVELHPSNDAIWQQPVMPDTLRGNGTIPKGIILIHILMH